MAVAVLTQEDCKSFVDDVFKAALGKDFDYVVRAVKEKMIRDGDSDECDQDNINQCNL